MNDSATGLPPDASISPSAVERAVAELERRVQALEVKVATIPDSKQLEEHVTARVKATLPPPPPPVDPSQPPSFKDITLPIPNVQTMVDTVKTTWTLVEMFAELKLLFWMLVDRRYHMAWITRIIALLLVAAILLSHLWLPFASFDNVFSRIWDKTIDLVLGVVLFMVLNFESRRYRDWRAKR